MNLNIKKILFVLIFSLIFHNVRSQNLYFPPITGSVWDTISPQTLNYCQDRIDSLYSFLDSENTKAFILLKDGKIVLEQYFNNHTQNSAWQWASAGKTITSFIVGLAQQNGFLSITDTVSSYLGQGWTNCSSEQENKITIKHQLNMTTGLDDSVADNHCTLDSCLVFKADAGTRWAYHNAPYTLLDQVIENATGSSLNQFTNQKLKIPTGMTGAFIKVGYNNVYFSNARSMARFGLLVLNNGNWNGNQILTDTTYFNQMINTSQNLNLSYGYLWWLNGKNSFMVPGLQFVFPNYLFSDAPSDMISALGKDGQILNIVPSENLIIVRMGESPDGTPVPFLLNNQIWQHVNNLVCNTNIEENKLNNNTNIRLFPNPSNNKIKISAKNTFSKIEIYNTHSQLIKTINTYDNSIVISIEDFTNGLYIVKVSYTDGSFASLRFIKN